MKEDTKMIPFDSPEAAKQVTVTLWRASDGRLYNEEHIARFAGCTHRPCEKCSDLTDKNSLLCSRCRGASDDARWAKRPRMAWDGKQMVYSLLADEYYSSPGDALDANEPYSLEELRLVLCNPEVASIDTDNFQDITPDDNDLPNAVLLAIKVFNESVSGVVCCWTPGEYALETA